MRKTGRMRAMLVISALLVGCSEHERLADLRALLDETNLAGADPSPLPEFEAEQPPPLADAKRRSPFEPYLNGQRAAHFGDGFAERLAASLQSLGAGELEITGSLLGKGACRLLVREPTGAIRSLAVAELPGLGEAEIPVATCMNLAAAASAEEEPPSQTGGTPSAEQGERP